MAGDWIKVEKDTPDKPEVLAIAARLGISPELAFKKCFRLWSWADSNTVNGEIKNVSPDHLDSSLFFIPGFTQALLDVGWLSVRSGSLIVPRFARHMGKPAKKRLLNAERQARKRHAGVTKKSRKERDKSNAPSSLLSSFEFSSEGGVGEAVEEVEIPEVLNTQEFLWAWVEWKKHREEIKDGKAMTARAERMQLKKLAAMGVAKAISEIERAIANGWKGIYESDAQPGKQPVTPAAEAQRLKEVAAAQAEDERIAREQWAKRQAALGNNA